MFEYFTYRFKLRRRRVYPKRASRREYLKHKESAREIVISKLAQFNMHYGYTYGRITIRNQKSRWGSCSKCGNLNFNFKIALLPERLVDYIVVHELCHLGQFNHSQDFWNLVGEMIPDYKKRVEELKKIGVSLG